MKIRNLLILLCAVLLQTLMSSCVENNNKSAEKTSAVTVEDALVQEDNPEVNTVSNFDKFVKEIIKNSPSKQPDSLICTEYKSRNELLAFILTLFGDGDVGKKEFGNTNKYESDYLKLEYVDENVKEGFAQVKLKFKKKEKTQTYKIVFKQPAK